MCLWAYHYATYLARDVFKIKPSPNPIPVGFLGRKQGIDFRKTTLETWHKVIPYNNYKYNEQKGELILAHGLCKLFVGGLDSTETINKFNSAELAFFALDQAEETSREDVSVLRGSLRLKVNDIQPHYKELYTANPSDCWLKEDFIDHDMPRHVYIPALPSDNKHLPDDYIETLEMAFKHSQPLLRAYRDGDWSALKSSNTLISSDDLNRIRQLDIIYPKDKRVVVCDPATSHDECVIYCLHNYQIIDELIIVGETDEMKIAGHIAMMCKKHKCLDAGGDSIGLGSGIFSRLEEMGEYRIHRINSTASSMNNKFLNMRAKFWWHLMEQVINKKIPAPTDEELCRQLINITYEVTDSSGKIKITLKEKIKKVIGRSPDRADAYAMGIWLSDEVEPWYNGDRREDGYANHDEAYGFNPATV